MISSISLIHLIVITSLSLIRFKRNFVTEKFLLFYYFAYPIDRSIEAGDRREESRKTRCRVWNSTSNNTREIRAKEETGDRLEQFQLSFCESWIRKALRSLGAPVLPPSKEKEKEEKRKARGGKMADGTDGTIIILDWCDAHNSEKETRMHTRAGEKKNFPRLANRPYRRTNYHPESQQSVPFSFARILAFSSTHHENFHLAPLIYRNLNLSLSLCV